VSGRRASSEHGHRGGRYHVVLLSWVSKRLSGLEQMRAPLIGISVNATFDVGASSARCYQTFTGVVRTLTYNLTMYTSTGSYVTVSDSTATSLSATWWNTTSVTMTAETVYFKSGVLEASPFIVRFKEADFQTSSADLTAPTSQSTATSSGAAATETHTKHSGLSTGAKAGIGVGAALGALLLVGVGFAIFWLRKKKTRRNHEKATETPVWNSEVDHASTPGELPTKWSTAELHAQPMPPKELQASRYREVNPDEPAELGDVSMSGR
jgi:hypothetical protein